MNDYERLEREKAEWLPEIIREPHPDWAEDHYDDMADHGCLLCDYCGREAEWVAINEDGLHTAVCMRHLCLVEYMKDYGYAPYLFEEDWQ